MSGQNGGQFSVALAAPQRKRQLMGAQAWAVFGSAASGVAETLKSGADLRFVDVVGIVGAAVPSEHFLFAAAALALVGAGDGVEERVIAGDAAAILGRAAPLAAAEVGIDHAGFG